MKIYAVSDIHGHLFELDEALNKIDLSGDNKLILLGDYTHGPNSYGVLDRIINLQRKYGSDKIIALCGNHERFVLEGTWPINENRFGIITEEYNEEKEAEYIEWMSHLPLYHTEGNAIFVHAGIDEDAAKDGFWEWGTSDYIFTDKYPWSIGKIEGLDKMIVAGHIGTHNIAHNPSYHDIYFDGGNHYYVDGTVQESGYIPVLMYDTEKDKYYRVTETDEWLILPYEEEF